MDINLRMQIAQESFSKSEKKIYKLLKKDPSVVKQYTITKLAVLAGTSTSAVLRFCKTLGCQGYKEFRYEMIQYLDSQSKHAEVPKDIPSQVINTFHSSISRINDITQETLVHLTDDICKSRTTFLLGLHYSFLAAKKLQMNLDEYGILSIAKGDIIDFNRLPYLIDSNSVIIIFSVSGDTHYYRQILDGCNDVSPKSWLITCNPSAKMKKYVQNTIILPSANIDTELNLSDHVIMMIFSEIISNMISKYRLEESV